MDILALMMRFIYVGKWIKVGLGTGVLDCEKLMMMLHYEITNIWNIFWLCSLMQTTQ